MLILKKLQDAIEKEIQGVKLKDVTRARESLTARYQKQGVQANYLTTDSERFAYIIARLPATFVVIRRVLQEIRTRITENIPHSLLDLGAGPGSVMWAACDLFPEINTITLIERDKGIQELGKRLASHNDHAAPHIATWKEGDLATADFPPHDLVALSYVIGEIPPTSIPPLIEKAWKSAEQFLVIIEPGTPAGFERIRAVRSQLISLGAHIFAPCPHADTCPMTGGDWCHFSERLDRSSFHRLSKEGSLSYEDEKYSYVIFSKQPQKESGPRILRPPFKHKGYMNFPVCAKEGLVELTVSRKMGDKYRRAKKLGWGDALI